ncbi:hypothetical protein ABKV19_017179 [Rosa sericea]
MRMSISRLSVYCLFLHLFILGISAIRKDVGFLQKQICRNTVQGRYLLSDDNGHVCDALSVNPQSRCCPEKGEKFSCHGCNVVSECCNSYEYCVSCCLDPSRIIKEQVLEVKIAKPASAGKYSSVFDFCAGRCRHNSESVVHENAYLSDFHHCFSLPSNSSVIQKYMSCKGTCLASIGSDQPAEVVDDAPEHLNPGACLYTQTQSMLSCYGSHQHTRRLCPCA